MAHIWRKEVGGWEAVILARAQTDFAALETAPAAGPGAGRDVRAQIIRAGAGGMEVWAVVAAPDSPVRVNGRPPLAGVCVLSDRDEIRVGGTQYFFSTESLARVEPFPAQERVVYCARCRQPIETGSPAVRCPHCATWYHQSASLPCYTYADKCTICGRPSALDADFTWAPEV
jgi:hypothetical protein